MRSPRRLAITMTVLFALVAAGCSSKPDPLEVGFRRVSLDLVFRDETKAPPIEPQKIIQVIEYFDEQLTAPEEEAPAEERPRRPRPPAPPPRQVDPPCLPAPEGTAYDVPTFGVPKDPPKVGTYTRYNQGTIGIEVAGGAGPIPNITLPYPPKTTWDITDVEVGRGTVATNPKDQETLGVELPSSEATPEVVRFTLTRNMTRDLRTIDTYQYYLDRGAADLDNSEADGDGLYLVRRETHSSFGTSVFTPTPPVLMVPIGEESEIQEVNVGAGIDRETNAAMSVNSKILSREMVDACGEVLDSYRVQVEEQFMDLSQTPPVMSGNLESGKPSFWNIAYSNNMLLIREEVHTVIHGSFEIAGAPVPYLIRLDYTSTVASPEPKPLQERPTSGVPTTTTTAPEEDET